MIQRGQLNGSNTAIVGGTLSFAQAWGLDAAGNWRQFWQSSTGASWDLQQSRAASTANEITAIIGGVWAQPAYDAAGNAVQIPDASMPTIAESATFDAWNRMMSVFGGGSLIQQNGYDGDNRRVTNPIGATLRHYYFSARWQVVEERLGNSMMAERQFVSGVRYIDDLVLRDRGTERFYATQDAIWNVTAICGLSGAVDERYVYTAYGEPAFFGASYRAEQVSAFGWERLFAGYQYDDDAQLSVARRRPLNSALGSWLMRDPIYESLNSGLPPLSEVVLVQRETESLLARVSGLKRNYAGCYLGDQSPRPPGIYRFGANPKGCER